MKRKKENMEKLSKEQWKRWIFNLDFKEKLEAIDRSTKRAMAYCELAYAIIFFILASCIPFLCWNACKLRIAEHEYWNTLRITLGLEPEQGMDASFYCFIYLCAYVTGVLFVIGIIFLFDALSRFKEVLEE